MKGIFKGEKGHGDILFLEKDCWHKEGHQFPIIPLQLPVLCCAKNYSPHYNRVSEFLFWLHKVSC